MREPTLSQQRLPRGLSTPARRGVLVVLCGVFGLIAIAGLPYLWNAQIREQVAAQKVELELVEARAEHAGQNRPRLTEADEVARMFLPGKTTGTTLAAMQSLVSKAGGNSGMSVLRMQPLPLDEVAGASPLRLSVDARGSLEQLRVFLIDIETMVPLIKVIGMDVVPRLAEGPDSQAFASEDLAVTLKLESSSWREAP